MNVGIVVPGFSASDDDWCIPALASLARRLSEHHRVRVFALRYPFERRRYSAFGAEVHALGGARVRGLSRVSLLLRAVRSIRREHGREPFDVLHAVWADEPGYVAVRAARALGVPSVVTIFGGELVARRDVGYGGLLSLLNRALVSRALARATAVTAGSTSVVELASSRRTSLFLPIGVDLDRFRPGRKTPSLLSGDPALLHVASLVPVKDPVTLLRAFARVARVLPGASLHVVGEGPLESELLELSRELAIAERVVFHGAVRHEDLPAYYRSSDLLVMSSLHEGQGLVVQEAAGCGRTTVGTRVGVVADLEPATIAVPPKSPASLAEGILSALSDPPLLRAREAIVRKRVVERYSLSGTLTALTALYARISAHGRAPQRLAGAPGRRTGFREGAST